jgi:hypothetical protein
MLRQVNLRADMVRQGTYGRKVVRPMTPRFITIHSTQNYSAGARQHSLALKNGALRSAKTRFGNRIGFLIWHFTVDQGVAIQHMPITEQGEHADFGGPGNRLSIGIEMCENRGSNLSATIERTAKLTAVLMKRNQIPLKNVVPHYHWPRRGNAYSSGGSSGNGARRSPNPEKYRERGLRREAPPPFWRSRDPQREQAPSCPPGRPPDRPHPRRDRPAAAALMPQTARLG